MVLIKVLSPQAKQALHSVFHLALRLLPHSSTARLNFPVTRFKLVIPSRESLACRGPQATDSERSLCLQKRSAQNDKLMGYLCRAVLGEKSHKNRLFSPRVSYSECKARLVWFLLPGSWFLVTVLSLVND